MSVPLLRSSLLADIVGVTHGFTTREGGASTGPYASLNLGRRTDDDRVATGANRRAVLDALGKSNGRFISLKQIHGDQIVEVTRAAGRSIPADGLYTRDPRAVISICVADCVPILFADVEATVVAAAHAGWRGTQARIAGKMVERLHKMGVPKERLRVAMGPAIGPCCFEIGDDVSTPLFDAFPGTDAIRQDGEQTFANLWALNQQALFDAGLEETQIDTIPSLYGVYPSLYSHRASGGTTGRQAGVIALTPPTS